MGYIRRRCKVEIMADFKILVDISVIIDFLGKKNKLKSALWSIKEKHECFISTVTLFELQCGAKTEQHIKDILNLRKVNLIILIYELLRKLTNNSEFIKVTART